MNAFDKRLAGSLAAALALGGCVGPMQPPPQMVPPPTSPAAVSADMQCRQYADAQTAPLRNQANASTVGSTLLGAGVGAALGAAVGGGRGAGIGAASGAALGLGAGAAGAQGAAVNVQQQYDMYYANCMAAQQGGPPPGQPPGYAPPSGYGPPSGPPSGYGPPSGRSRRVTVRRRAPIRPPDRDGRGAAGGAAPRFLGIAPLGYAGIRRVSMRAAGVWTAPRMIASVLTLRP